MKRRILAVLLALVLVLPAVAVRSDADEQIVIAWNEPAIPADAGTAVDLSAYSVQFASGEAASAYVDWMYEGRPISAFTPPSEGVYKLTADDGSGTAKDVYVVAKKPEDTEYVLYFNDFDSADSLEGFTLSTTASRFTVSGSDLVIDATGMDMARVTLPEWLGVFGNYCITARVTSAPFALWKSSITS